MCWVNKPSWPVLIDTYRFVKTRFLFNLPLRACQIRLIGNIWCVDWPFLIDILSFVQTRISQILSNKPDWQYVVGKVCHKVAVGAMSGCHKEKWNGMSSTVVA